MWINNTEGKPDAMLTFATVAFIAVTLNILLATIGQVNYDGHSVTFTSLDSGTMGVYLAATFSAYVSRRLTDKVYKKSSKEKSDEPKQ